MSFLSVFHWEHLSVLRGIILTKCLRRAVKMKQIRVCSQKALSTKKGSVCTPGYGAVIPGEEVLNENLGQTLQLGRAGCVLPQNAWGESSLHLGLFAFEIETCYLSR